MNRFRFRLESVLRFRSAREEEKKREFGTALGHLKHEESRYNKVINSIENHDSLTEESSKGKISVRKLIHNFFYARHLDKSKAVQKQTVKKAGEALDVKRSELTEATKKKKVLERLKERKLEDYNKASLKEEQVLIDEIAAQRFNHEDTH